MGRVVFGAIFNFIGLIFVSDMLRLKTFEGVICEAFIFSVLFTIGIPLTISGLNTVAGINKKEKIEDK